MHHGDPGSLALTYDAVLTRIAALGRAAAGPVIEEYLGLTRLAAIRRSASAFRSNRIPLWLLALDRERRPCYTGYTSAMKVAVSIPDELYGRADDLARRLGLNRSQLYARSVEKFLAAHDYDPVTAALDALAEGSSDGGAGVATARRLIERGQWDW